MESDGVSPHILDLLVDGRIACIIQSQARLTSVGRSVAPQHSPTISTIRAKASCWTTDAATEDTVVSATVAVDLACILMRTISSANSRVERLGGASCIVALQHGHCHPIISSRAVGKRTMHTLAFRVVVLASRQLMPCTRRRERERENMTVRIKWEEHTAVLAIGAHMQPLGLAVVFTHSGTVLSGQK
jgi:hypothetical protein